MPSCSTTQHHSAWHMVLQERRYRQMEADRAGVRMKATKRLQSDEKVIRHVDGAAVSLYQNMRQCKTVP